MAYISTTVHDAKGEVVASMNALGSLSTVAYDAIGNAVSMMNARGYVSTTVFDALNRAQVQIDALGYARTNIFDANGRRTVIVDPRGHSLTTVYTPRDQVSAAIDQLGDTTTNVYDGVGRLTARQRASGRAMTYSYDPNGRKVGALYLAGERATFVYDPTGNRTTMVDWTGTTTYAYDALGRMNSRTDPGALLLSLTRDAAGQLTNFTPPSGATTTYQFDLDGRITTVQDVDQQILKVYDAARRLISLTVQESVSGIWQDVSQTLYGLDALSQATTIIHTNGTNPVQTIISTYDAIGELTQQVVDGLVSTFAYDPVGSVASEQHGTSQPTTYTHDPSHNRTVKNAGGAVTSNTYDAAQCLVTSILGSALATYTHDPDGNITVENLAGTVTTFAWGDDEAMHNIFYSTGAISTYTYDGDGRRRSYIEPGGTLTTIVYLGRDILEERS